MRKLLLALALLWIGPAFAQNVQCPTRPVGSTGNACASLDFFWQNLTLANISGLGAGVATWLAAPSSANLAAAMMDETGTGALAFANSPVFTTPNIGSATGHASLDCALTGCTLSGPLVSSSYLDVALSSLGAVPTLKNASNAPVVNLFSISGDNLNASTGFIIGTQDQYLFGGTGAYGNRAAGADFIANTAATNSSNAARNYVARISEAYTSVGDGGTNLTSGAKGSYFGINPQCQLDPGATYVYECNAAEYNTIVNSGASVKYLIGNEVVGYNLSHGGSFDAAYAIGGGSVGNVGWNYGFAFTDINTGSPVGTGTTLFGAYWSSIPPPTVTTGIDLTQFVFSGNAFQSTGYSVDAAGDVIGAKLTATNAHILATSTSPSISACGASSPSVAGSDNFGTISTGSGTLTSCVINFGHAWGTTPACTVSFSASTLAVTVARSTTQLSIGATSLTSETITYICGSVSELEPANDNFAKLREAA